MPEARLRTRMIIDGLFRILALASVACGLCACGQVKIAGGTSEVGNPSSSLLDGEEEGGGDGSVTGFAISAQGSPLKIIRDKRSQDKDSAQAQAAPDSASSH